MQERLWFKQRKQQERQEKTSACSQVVWRTTARIFFPAKISCLLFDMLIPFLPYLVCKQRNKVTIHSQQLSGNRHSQCESWWTPVVWWGLFPYVQKNLCFFVSVSFIGASTWGLHFSVVSSPLSIPPEAHWPRPPPYFMWAELHVLEAAICFFLHCSNLLVPFSNPGFQQLETGLQTKGRENSLCSYHITEIRYLKSEEIPVLLCLSQHRCQLLCPPSAWFLGIFGERFPRSLDLMDTVWNQVLLSQSESLKRWPTPFLFCVVFNICLHYPSNMFRSSEHIWQFL